MAKTVRKQAASWQMHHIMAGSIWKKNIIIKGLIQDLLTNYYPPIQIISWVRMVALNVIKGCGSTVNAQGLESESWSGAKICISVILY